jgi:Reverse transcriptase (RNA-dependent DNA polymerase)
VTHEPEKSDSVVVAVKPANKAARAVAEPGEPRTGTKGNADQQSTRRAQDRASVSQALARVRQAARQRKKEKFTALLHHISPAMLRAAFYAIKRDAAPGVDGMTWETYEQDLDLRIEDLNARVKSGAYRALPSRRSYIPKEDGSKRPLAVAALEDKIVQRATAAVLSAIYEEDFLGFSYGFRPGRSQHDALDALIVGITSRKVNFILDARHPVVLHGGFPGMGRPLPGAPDRRQAHHPARPEMAAGRRPRRRDRDDRGEGDGPRLGNFAAARQRLPPLCLRSLGGALATARSHRRHDHRALCR